jgi:hypothetical protein
MAGEAQGKGVEMSLFSCDLAETITGNRKSIHKSGINCSQMYGENQRASKLRTKDGDHVIRRDDAGQCARFVHYWKREEIVFVKNFGHLALVGLGRA